MKISVFFRCITLIRVFTWFFLQMLWYKSHKQGAKILAQNLRSIFEYLGPVYIKLGQILSLRPDFLPEAYCQELEHCLENTTVVDPKYMEPYRKNLIDPIRTFFTHIQNIPFASASISEVYKAELLDGRKVVLKVIKPNIRTLIERDIAVLHIVCTLFGSFIGKVGKAHWKNLADQLSHWLDQEINLEQERENMEILRKELIGKNIYIPQTYPHLSSKDLLVMEYIPGKTLLTLMQEYRKGKTSQHFSLQEKLIYIVEILGLESLERDYLHADLHPANIVVSTKGEITLLDCGLVEYFDFKTRQGLTLFLMGAVMGSAELILHSAKKIAKIPQGFDEDKAFKTLDRFCKQYSQAKLNEISTGQFMMRIITLCMKENIHFDWSIILYTKSALGLDGVGLRVHPDFYFSSFAREKVLRIYAKNTLRDASSLPHIIKRFDTAFESWKAVFS